VEFPSSLLANKSPAPGLVGGALNLHRFGKRAAAGALVVIRQRSGELPWLLLLAVRVRTGYEAAKERLTMDLPQPVICPGCLVWLNGTIDSSSVSPIPSMMITISSPICMRDFPQSITAVHTMPGCARPIFSRIEFDQVWKNTQVLASSIAGTSSTLCAATPCTIPTTGACIPT
jgi:hypothetical protein